MNRLTWLMTGFAVCSLGCIAPQDALAEPGNSASLTLLLTMEQSTCDVGLLTPATIMFPAVNLNIINAQNGHITFAGDQTVTLALTNCAGSAKAGAVPAIRIAGTTPIAANPNLFRDGTSTAQGNVGFGVRYEPTPGQPQGYLQSGSYVDLGAAGEEVTNRNLNFLIDMLHGPIGDTPSSGSLIAKISFQFAYH